MADYRDEIKGLLQTLVETKADMKAALIEKNSTPTGGETTYAAAIRAIKSEEYTCHIEYPTSMGDVTILMGDEDITETVMTDGIGNIAAITGNLVISFAQKMYINYALTNITSSNNKASVLENTRYTTTLTPDTGYEWGHAEILMDGVDITSTVFNGDTGIVDIPKVIGNVSINVVGQLKTYAITTTLPNASKDNSITNVEYGKSYSVTIAPSEGYVIDSITATMGGEPVVVNDNIVSIPRVTGDIEIIAVTSKIVYSITNTLSYITTDNITTNIEYGEAYAATLTPDEGYEFSTVSVTMGGQPVVVSNGSISIAKVTGNIVINATATKIVYNIVRVLTHVAIDNVSDTIEYGEAYTATISPEAGYNLGTVTVTMGGEPVAVANGVINIAKVTGNINITASAALNTVSITNNLTHVTNSNNATEVNYGAPYAAILAAEEYYDLTGATITMGGVDITDDVYNNGAINIPSVTGEIVITSAGQIKVATITYNFTSTTATTTVSAINYGESYTTTISSTKKNWSVQSIQVSMGGVDITDTAVNGLVVTIPVVTGNIVIAAVASNAKTIGEVVTVNNVISINDGELPSGTYKMRYEDIDGNPIPNMDDITTFTI